MGNCFGQTGWSWKLSRSNADDLDPIIDDHERTSNDSAIFRILRFKRRRINTKKFFTRILTNRPSLSDYVVLDRGEGTQQGPPPTTTEISMQYLDAQSLLLLARGGPGGGEPERQMQYCEFGTANSSQCGSSLDLEWENEYEESAAVAAPSSSVNQMLWLNIRQPHALGHKSPSSFSSDSSEKKDNSIECSAKVHERKAGNSWSHISTPDSMEWDVVTEDNRLKSEDCDSVDQDTRDLLYEIEQLKNRALQETGQFDYDLNKYTEAANAS